jgi:precorrin-4/cobalt-precorrin-4 C11-methyltransferase
MAKVFFIGAGPGDPELITIKGKKAIECSDIIIYAGSLVNKEVIDYKKKDAIVHNSAEMTLEEVIKVIKEGVDKGFTIARVHSGDPTIYGAIREQIDILTELKIDYEVIPGVSSFTASAAAINKEFTLPGISQTIICTRLEGRTPVPGKESLEKLAKHRASMAIFLSIQNIKKAVEKLLTGYEKETPVAVVYRATWKEQKIIFGTLNDIAGKIKNENIKKSAMILVGDFLGSNYEKSKLYDASFSHEYRGKK